MEISGITSSNRREISYSFINKMLNSNELKFVVQMHAASHLHYDFRLEIDGVLVSWAIPKKLSLDPKVKRLAVKVNDHVMSYINFEGTIEKGKYGAGSVLVWDRGTYTSSNLQPISKQLKEGKLSITLKGSKLKGNWHLFKLKGANNPNWMIMKTKDSFSGDIVLNDKSVISGKTIDKIK